MFDPFQPALVMIGAILSITLWRRESKSDQVCVYRLLRFLQLTCIDQITLMVLLVIGIIGEPAVQAAWLPKYHHLILMNSVANGKNNSEEDSLSLTGF